MTINKRIETINVNDHKNKTKQIWIIFNSLQQTTLHNSFDKPIFFSNIYNTMTGISIALSNHQQETHDHRDEHQHHTTNENHDDDVEPPSEFVCPITQEIMNEPVMSRNGATYERKAILEWLNAGKVDCPLTRQPLKPSSLVPNANLRVQINSWKREHGISYEYVDSSQEKKLDFIGLLDPKHNDMSLRSLYTTNTATVLASLSADIEQEQQQQTMDAPPRRMTASLERTEDDMNDLLELYNDVLELIDTNASRTNNIGNRRSD